MVLCVTHGDMQSRLVNVLLARHMGLPDWNERAVAADNSYDAVAAAGAYARFDAGCALTSFRPPARTINISGVRPLPRGRGNTAGCAPPLRCNTAAH